MALIERLDDRLEAEPAPDAPGLASRWKAVKRERDAQVFDNIADQIEQGLLKVKGAKKGDVVQRLRTRAEGTREGTDRLKRKAIRPSSEE